MLKLSQITKVPQGRRVYRGLGGMVLDDKWFVQDKRNTRGGVELGFLSTTLNRSTALEYSGVKRGRGIILEIDVGAIDCGAQLDSRDCRDRASPARSYSACVRARARARARVCVASPARSYSACVCVCVCGQPSTLVLARNCPQEGAVRTRPSRRVFFLAIGQQRPQWRLSNRPQEGAVRRRVCL